MSPPSSDESTPPPSSYARVVTDDRARKPLLSWGFDDIVGGCWEARSAGSIRRVKSSRVGCREDHAGHSCVGLSEALGRGPQAPPGHRRWRKRVATVNTPKADPSGSPPRR